MTRPDLSAKRARDMAVHILHIHSTFSLGGKEARAVRLMNAFGDAARHTIVSAMPDQLGARDAIAPGIRYEIAQDPPALTGKLSVARYEAIARFMSRFDLVLTYNWGAMDAVMAARTFAKGVPPIVHHEDGFNADEAERLKPQRNMYRRVALGAVKALAVPSETLEDIALDTWKQPRARVHRIPNGIAVDRYATPPKPDAIPGFRRKKGEVVIGTLAGLRDVKDLPMLVRAVAGVPVPTRLVIVGEGPERARIEAAAAAMDMADTLHLPGFLPEPWRYIGLFDIFALSSKSEQFPISVIEAMAAGLPVASPHVGDVSRMLSMANYPFVAPNIDEVELRDSITAFARDPEKRKVVGEANRARAKADYDERIMIARYAALYGEALGKPGVFG
ncbi:glycosyltransferase family 4 protein [Hephaestia mangrovi]|uniref:glycosyltransferase family 4 protein n=1 Tax=Hephaestia mangrovi TaxID=2873268 RepID=UPI0021061E9F|nr:glycosyltransferase family 4 protein [Hephaestia mangrovi]